ncbi:MAG: hypothetical protein GY847_11920 [Proteobacteria bacterium]|nr:hypothetical protein [Pseudomonadota bacterium]
MKKYLQPLGRTATLILTTAGLLFIPFRVIVATGATWPGIGIAILIAGILGGHALYYLFPSIVQRRFGISRYQTRTILARKIEKVSIDEKYVATVDTVKTLIYLDQPTKYDLVDIVELLAEEELDETIYRSTDSTVADVVRNKKNTVAVFWRPKREIVIYSPYMHRTSYRCPSLYGDDAFYQAYHVDLETGLVDWTFSCSHKIDYAVAFLMPVLQNKITLKRLCRLSFSGSERGCEQPSVSKDGMTIKWRQKTPEMGRTYVCMAFYEDGAERFRRETEETFLMNRIRMVIAKLLDKMGGQSQAQKSPLTKRLQGTPTSYLPPVVGVGFAASPDVNSWLKGRP